MIKSYTIVFYLILSVSVFGKPVDDKGKIMELIDKCHKFYEKSQSFEIAMNYNLYNSAESKIVTENYSGVISMRDQNFYSKIGTTEFLKLNRHFVKVDHKGMAMEYNIYNSEDENFKFYNIIGPYLNYFSKFSLTSKGNSWKCTMSTAAISMVPYSKVVLYIDKTTYELKKQVLFLLLKNNYKDSKGKIKSDYPRLEITSNQNKGKSLVNIDRFDINNYVTISKSKVLPSSKLNRYKFIDLSKQ